MDPIECFITVATGAQGHGKSVRTIQELKVYVKSDPKRGRKGRPVLIHDSNNEYDEFKPVKYDVEDESDNGKYFSMHRTPEIRRIRPFLKSGHPMGMDHKQKALLDISNYYRNGLLLIEDLNTYVDRIDDPKIVSFLVNTRHRGLDLMIHFQSLSAMPPRLWQNVKVIRFHYQSDNIDRYKNRIPNFELIKIAQYIVNKEYSYYVSNKVKYKDKKYYFVYIDIQANKIRGASKEQFIHGCMEYVNKFMSKEIKQEMAASRISREEAVKQIVRNKMQLYIHQSE